MTYPLEVAVEFNRHINERDIEKLSDMMTEDHTFIDPEGDKVEGKEEMVKTWEGFFEEYQFYRNIFEHAIMKNSKIIFIGYSSCSFEHLDGPAIWSANIEGHKVSEWRAYSDDTEDRKKLGVPPEL